jgi:peptide/nickel transport system permease protein
MTTYLIRRIIQGILVLFLSSFVVYSLLVITPGGPIDQITQSLKVGGGTRGQYNLNTADIERMKKAFDLDKPWPISYLAWLFDPSDNTMLNEQDEVVPKGLNLKIGDLEIRGSGVLIGDLGNTVWIQRGMPVAELMGTRIVNTLILTFSSLFIAILVAFPVGIISAIRQYSRLDYAVTTFSFFGLSMPSFWLALMLIIFFAVLPREWHDQNGWTWMPYLPPGNVADTGREDDIINRIYHLVLPVTVLAFLNIAGFSRYVRSSMLEVLRQDYVRTAWAKGLSQRVVILKHALRNALIPMITIVTLSIPFLFSGAIITETVFAYAGMGQLYFQAVSQLDIPLAMGFLVILTALIIASNILADVLYAVTDPRIRYS